MKGFRKMDEMEKYISYKSVFWTYAYMITFLAVWVIINLLNKVSDNIPLFLLVTQMLLGVLIRFNLKKKMYAEDEKQN